MNQVPNKLSPLDAAILGARNLGVGMAHSMATDIAIRQLHAVEQDQVDQLGAPAYYDAVNFGLLWHELASDPMGEA